MQIALKVLVGLIGLLLGVLGVRWVFAPESVAAELGIGLSGAVALNTARGDVGGLFIGGALLCGLALARGDGHPLRAAALLLGCVAAGRTVGIATDGFAPESATAIAVELAMIAVLLLAARRMPGAIQS
jgi:hypothetical protein